MTLIQIIAAETRRFLAAPDICPAVREMAEEWLKKNL